MAEPQPTGLPVRTLACRVFGCKWRFWAEGEVLHGRCERCGASRIREYPNPADATRYAAFLDRPPRKPMGLFGILSGTLIRDPEGSKRKTQDES